MIWKLINGHLLRQSELKVLIKSVVGRVTEGSVGRSILNVSNDGKPSIFPYYGQRSFPGHANE
ncbi:hypothetical protein SAMN04488057_104170 [Cyclobacterium lianum]|uniref:Uncharacterized protein n=1 Tax=Cyclobacterium lianum TaxID=388280 RepID=A0A1M7M936_9BACT|nr:hypothetical protein SAMN04488057_104170 [Cyclobacterium lianum]